MLSNAVEFLHHLHHQSKTLQRLMVNLHHHHNHNNLHQLNKNILMLAPDLQMVFMVVNAVNTLLHVPDKERLISHAQQEKLSILKL
jgi:hypothetical protein